MTQPSDIRPVGFIARIRDRAEEIIYQLNERQHWIFRIYD
jgi:hypothetical protein